MAALVLLSVLTYSLLTAAANAVPALPPASCSTTTQLQLAPDVAGNREATFNATLAPGCQQIFYLAGDACDSDSFLMLELWDLDAAGLGVAELAAAMQRAQPFLVVARGQAPQVLYNASSSTWSFSPANSLSDAAGQSLLRPYLMVQTSFGTVMGPQASPAPPGCSAEQPCWYATVLNSQLGADLPLDLQFRASCAAAPRCPQPLLGAGACSGRGMCQAQAAAAGGYATAACACEPGWGDAGCEAPLQALPCGTSVLSAGLPPGEWQFWQLELPPGDGALAVQLQRSRGDPILFLKGAGEGFQPGALPSTLDYSQFADRASWRERSDRAQLLRADAAPGGYYVAVFNNDDDIQEAANFSLRAACAPPGTPLCPWGCGGQGTCGAGGVCTCNPGFGGSYCQGSLNSLAFGAPKTGSLRPGGWAYLSLDLTAPATRGQALQFDFSNDAGQGILIASFSAFPTLLTANFTLRTTQLAGALTQVIQARDLAPAVMYVGIYNMDYYVHAPFNWALSVSQTGSPSGSYAPWVSVVIAVSCSVVVAAAIYTAHRLLARRRAGARGLELLALWRPLPLLPVVAPQQARRLPRRGLDPAIVAGFPTFVFDSRRVAAGSQTPGADKLPEEETVCSVCLFGYEDGELIRTLPCRHDFHCDCIDQWLRKRGTCPMCRVSLVPEGSGELEPVASGGSSASEEAALSAASEGQPPAPEEEAAARGRAAAAAEEGEQPPTEAEVSGRQQADEARLEGSETQAEAAGGEEGAGRRQRGRRHRPQQAPAAEPGGPPGRRQRASDIELPTRQPPPTEQ